MEGGERIAHYRLVRKLGQGGMGEVYRAVDERLGRSVALKLLPPAQANEVKSQARLVREAQAASHLNHPGIVTVHDVGIWRGRVYLVMELVEGQRFTELIRTGVEATRAISLCAQAAEALAAAHQRGILHRDIKPDNLMVSVDGRVKVLDFGIAKLRATTEHPEGSVADERTSQPSLDALLPTVPASQESTPIESERASGPDLTLLSRGDEPIARDSPWPSPTPVDLLTEADSLLGTPAYMSPEQAARERVDVRSEIFSLGLVLYELLTRTRPFARASLDETLAAATAAAIPPLDQTSSIPRPLVRVLGRALARDPAARFGDMADFGGELAKAAAALKPNRRRRRALLASAAAVIAASVALVLLVAPSADSAPRFSIESVRGVTTDPGCEEYPSFSHDGREIVFDGMVDGDFEIQAMSVDGTTRRRLTHSEGWDVGAEVAPDGLHVAYVHFGEQGRELRVIEIAGDRAVPPRVIGQVRGYPTWSSRGELLYGDDAGRIWRATLAPNTPPVEVARLPVDHIAPYLDVFPNGELALSISSRAHRTSLLSLARAQPGSTATLASPEWLVSDAARIRVDHAGRGLFYVAPTSDGSQKIHWRSRNGGPAIVLEAGGVSGSFALSPRADQLVYSTCQTRMIVGRIGQRGFAPLARMGHEWDPGAFTPLGEDVLVVSTRSRSIPQIWRMRADGLADRLVDQPATDPAASRDGSLLAWSGMAPGPVGIHVRALAGGPIRRLTEEPTDEQPRFSLDGKRVFFTRTANDGARVHVVSIEDGRPPVPVSSTGVIAFAVAPNDDRLALIATDGERRTVLVGLPNGPFHPVPGLEPRNYNIVEFSAGGTRLLLAPDPSSLIEVDPRIGGSGQPIWSSKHETLHQIRSPSGGDVWALVSADEGDLFLVEGHFR